MNLLELKRDRLSDPERGVLDIFDGLVESVDGDHPYIILYKKGNMLIFKYDSKDQLFYFSYQHISIFLYDNFRFGYYETYELVQSMVRRYLNIVVNKMDILILTIH